MVEEDLNDGIQNFLGKCDCCNQEIRVYDMGSHFVCKKCCIECQETVKKKIIKLNLNKTDLIDWLSDCLYFKNQKDLNNCDNDIKFRKNIYKLN